MQKHHYTPEQLDDAALRDLVNDAECADRQAVEGPFYPERGITAESLIAYAANCRLQVTKYANGGAHVALVATNNTGASH